MQYIQGLENYDSIRDTAVTFGKFDGLHIGHQKLIATVKELQTRYDIDSIVCAFDMHASDALMLSEERELHLYDEVDYLVECPFTEAFRQISAEDFIKQVIIGTFHASFVIVGTDFSFGRDREGDVHMLSKYQEMYGYRLVVIEKEKYQDHIISSTYIKNQLKEGHVELADTLLGYNFGVSGIVEHGRQLGRTMGFPTLNVAWPEKKIVPPYGVYLCRVYMDGEGYNSIGNIGVRPTVTDEQIIWIETFLLNYEGDAYEKEVTIELLEFVRPEQKFSGKDELKARVDQDIAYGKNYFAKRNVK